MQRIDSLEKTLRLGGIEGRRRRVMVSQVLRGKQKTQETQVRSLGREDPLEKETATHSSVLV